MKKIFDFAQKDLTFSKAILSKNYENDTLRGIDAPVVGDVATTIVVDPVEIVDVSVTIVVEAVEDLNSFVVAAKYRYLCLWKLV